MGTTTTKTTDRPLIRMPGVQTQLNYQEEQALLRVLREANTVAYHRNLLLGE